MLEYKVQRNRGMFEVRLGTFVYEVFRDELVAGAFAASLNRLIILSVRPRERQG